MTARPATPARYLVDRNGTPDPEESRYYVLDVVHDFEARVALRALARRYRSLGAAGRAEELEALLDGTTALHGEVTRRLSEAKAPPARRRR